jgi:adenylate kinase family enzyme
MKKISVFGLPATGKSTFARELAGRLGVPHLDMDTVLFQGGKPIPIDQFRAETGAFTGNPAWVVEGNYSALADVTWHRSDVVIWLDYPLWLIYWRLTRRAWRRVRGVEPSSPLPWRVKFLSRRNLAWTVTRKYLWKRPEYRRDLAEVTTIRFRSPRRAATWLETAAPSLTAATGAASRAPARPTSLLPDLPESALGQAAVHHVADRGPGPARAPGG